MRVRSAVTGPQPTWRLDGPRSPVRGMERTGDPVDEELMSPGTARAATLAAACAFAVASAAPALAETPPGSGDPSVPGVLATDLSAAEEEALADLTADDGVGFSALVDTADGVQVVRLEAGS